MHGRVADVPTGQARQLERLVEQVAVRRQEGDLLQRDDVRVPGDDLRRDPLEPLAADVHHHAGGNGSPGPIAADVRGGDPDGRRGRGHPAT